MHQILFHVKPVFYPLHVSLEIVIKECLLHYLSICYEVY